MDAELGKYFLVAGRVQGVGFRNYTQVFAQQLTLKGWVRNLKDGRVEGVAFGSPDSLKTFIEILSEGPQIAVVDHLDVYSLDLTEESSQNEYKKYRDFEIEQDGDSEWQGQK